MRFVSKRLEPRYIMIPDDRMIDEQRRVQYLRGKKAEFRNHQYTTDDPEMIDFLLNHKAYGIEFVSDQPDVPVKIEKPLEVPPWETDDVLKTELEQARRLPVTPMVQGAISTGQVPTTPPESAVVTKEEVIQLVEDKMKSLNDKLDNLIMVLSADKAPAAQVVKPKKEFHCPICKQEFKSGVEVGKHKKEAHPSN